MFSVRKHTLMGHAFAIASLSAATVAAPQSPKGVQVAEQGQTHITANTVDGPVDVTVSTRFAMPGEAGSSGATRCSGGRTRCSLVSQLRITVGNGAVNVPDRATILLSDVDNGSVRMLSANSFELIIRGGDAAAAYEARLFFNKNRVTKLDIWSSEAHRIEQSTVYPDISKAFS